VPARTSASPPPSAAWIATFGNKPVARRAGNPSCPEPELEEWLKRFRRATYAGTPFGSEEFVERARQPQKTIETPLAPAAWIREPNSPCYDFSGKSAL